MAQVGGDWVEFTFSGTGGTYRFAPVSTKDSDIDLGGTRSETRGMAGGQRIKSMNAKPAYFKSTIGWDMSDRADLESVQAMSDDPDGYTFTAEHINGAVYVFTNASPEGDIIGKGNDAMIDITIYADSAKQL